MPRFKQEYENEDGWSNWVYPNRKNYKMGCCDCGLVHDIVFKIMEVSREKPNGTFTEKKIIDRKTVRVKFKARRNKRSTAAIRRNKK